MWGNPISVEVSFPVASNSFTAGRLSTSGDCVCWLKMGRFVKLSSLELGYPRSLFNLVNDIMWAKTAITRTGHRHDGGDICIWCPQVSDSGHISHILFTPYAFWKIHFLYGLNVFIKQKSVMKFLPSDFSLIPSLSSLSLWGQLHSIPLSLCLLCLGGSGRRN